MNLCVFEGRFTRDPEMRQTQDSNVVNFTLAVDSEWGRDKETSFFDYEAWGQTADTIVKFFKKGDLIQIRDSNARSEKWTDKEGNNRSRVRYRVNRFLFPPVNKGRDRTEEEAPDAGEKVEKQEAPEAAPPRRGRPAAPAKPVRRPVPVAVEEDDDDEIPFG